MRYVYCLSCDDIYKIGIAEDVKKRVFDLQTGNPREILQVFTFAFDDDTARRVERVFHAAMKYKRARREWFFLNERDIFFLKKVCLATQAGDDSLLNSLRLASHGNVNV